LTPGFSGQHCQPDFCVEIKFNSLGLRDEEFNFNEQYDYKILVLGDSVAFGNGVRFEDMSLKILEDKFKKDFQNKKIRVIKAGIPGYGTLKELLYFKHFGYKFKPDLVITIFVGNDLLENTKKDYHKVVNGYLVLDADKSISKIRVFLNTKSQLYCFFKKKIFSHAGVQDLLYKIFYGSKCTKDNELENSTFKGNLEVTKNYLHQLDEAVKSYGIKHIVILTPGGDQLDLNQRISEFCRQNNIDAFDTTSEFLDYAKKSKTRLYFKSDPHFNIEGNRVFAEIIYESLKDKIALY
jgi:lysophospholipase L1-like esterase